MNHSEARWVVAARTTKALLLDIGSFVIRPTIPPATLPFGKAALAVLAIIFVLDAGISYSLVIVEWGVEAAGHEAPTFVDPGFSVGEMIFYYVIIAPLFEEAIFRGWLSGRRRSLVYGAVAITSIALVMLIPEDWALAGGFAQLACLIALFIHWRVYRKTPDTIPAIFRNHYAWFIWGSSLVFGLVHLGNYSDASVGLDLLYILPQTLGGLLLAYTRTRIGLWACIAQHAAFNALYSFEATML
jgi:membrane protease YdiL (CAAX protease family)